MGVLTEMLGLLVFDVLEKLGQVFLDFLFLFMSDCLL